MNIALLRSERAIAGVHCQNLLLPLRVVARRSQTRGIKQLIDDLGIAHGDGISGDKSGTLHPLVSERLLARFEICAANHFGAVRSELGVVWLTTKAGFVKAINVIARLLELHLDEERGTHTNPAFVDAADIRATLGNSVRPVGET